MTREDLIGGLYAYNTKQYFKLLFGNIRVLYDEGDLVSKPLDEVALFTVTQDSRSILRSSYSNVLWLSEIGSTLHPLDKYLSLLGIKDPKKVDRLQLMYKGRTSNFYSELNRLYYTGKLADTESRAWDLYREVHTNGNNFYVFEFAKTYGNELLDRFMLAFVSNLRKFTIGVFDKSAYLKVAIEKALSSHPDFLDRFLSSVDSYIAYKKMGRQELFWYEFLTVGIR